MKKQGLEIIKDLIVSILIVVCIIIILSIIFYDDISLGKVIPEPEEYLMSEDIKEAIKEADLEEIKEVVTEYYIDASDLKKYEKTKEYNKGKKNPFAADESSPNNTNSTTSSNENSSTNFYEDDGTK